MSEQASRIEIPERDIVVPGEVVAAMIESQPGLDVEAIRAALPINVARGVPGMMDEGLVRHAELKFIDRHGPMDYGTYSGDKYEQGDDRNAFRGDGEYIQLAIDILRDEWGIEVSYDQLMTGTGGGQDLITEIMNHLILDEDRYDVSSTSRSFDRTLRDIRRRQATISRAQSGLLDAHGNPARPKTLTAIPQNAEGIDLDSLEDFFRESESKSVFFLVSDGSNPDGFTADIQELEDACKLADLHNGRIVIDAAYSRLFFDESNRTEYGELQPYINNGTLFIIFTATKEGGKRDTAFAVGSKEVMDTILKGRFDERLSPSYRAQKEQVLVERATEADLVGLESLDLGEVLTLQRYLAEKLRPALALAFTTVKSILDAADIRMSNPDLTHGYNVSVLLPADCTPAQATRFFAKLKGFGINSPDLTNFTAVGKAEPGLRIPFGGFSPEQCAIIAHAVVEAHKETFGS